MNRLEGPLDGVLHLMDRQVVDKDGLMVSKVDDIELTELADGSLVVTGLLVGLPVWLARLSGWMHERWRRLGGAQRDRKKPYRIGFEEVDTLTEEIRLRRPRAGVMVREGTALDGSLRRHLGDLLDATVTGPEHELLGHVLDVRLAPEPDTGPDKGPGVGLVLTGLVVGRGRPGSYLGYDRHAQQGPWLVNRVVRWLHRHSGLVNIEDVESIDWQRGTVRVSSGLEPLTPAGTTGEPERDR